MDETGQPGAAAPGENGNEAGSQGDLARPVSGWEPAGAGWSQAEPGAEPVRPRWAQPATPLPTPGWASPSARYADLPAPFPPAVPAPEVRSAQNGRQPINGFGPEDRAHPEAPPTALRAPASAPPYPHEDEPGDPSRNRLAVPAQRPAPVADPPTERPAPRADRPAVPPPVAEVPDPAEAARHAYDDSAPEGTGAPTELSRWRERLRSAPASAPPAGPPTAPPGHDPRPATPSAPEAAQPGAPGFDVPPGFQPAAAYEQHGPDQPAPDRHGPDRPEWHTPDRHLPELPSAAGPTDRDDRFGPPSRTGERESAAAYRGPQPEPDPQSGRGQQPDRGLQGVGGVEADPTAQDGAGAARDGAGWPPSRVSSWPAPTGAEPGGRRAREDWAPHWAEQSTPMPERDPSRPAYAPASGGPAYPPPVEQAGHPPVSGVPGHPPVSGVPAYPPVSGVPGHPPVSGVPAQPLRAEQHAAYPPASTGAGYPQAAAGPVYPPADEGAAYPQVTGPAYPSQPTGPGYPPPPGVPGYPPASGGPGYPPPPGVPGYPPASGGSAYPPQAEEPAYPMSPGAPAYPYPREGDYPSSSSYPGYPPQPTETEALPQRVPAEPDVPTVPEPPAESAAETPELARIATHLRREEAPSQVQDRPEGFDVEAILAAVRGVGGVRDASLRRTPAGAHNLRLDLSDGADPAEVSRQVARLLQERMGLAAAPQNLPGPAPAPAPAPTPTPAAAERRLADDVPEAAADVPRRRRAAVTPHRGRAQVEERPEVEAPAGSPAAIAAASANPVMANTSYSGSQPTTTETAPSRPLNPGGPPGPRVILEHVQVSTFGLEATVEVRLTAGGHPAAGLATGPAVDGYVLRLCAVSAATAIDELLRLSTRVTERGRCFVEHAAVVPFGSCEVATVVVLLVCDGWVEQLAGSALVAGDPRQAVVRATLAAVNRRLEALLA